MMSPTLLESYIGAAGKISRLAVGDPGADVNHVSGSDASSPMVIAIANGHYNCRSDQCVDGKFLGGPVAK